MRGTQRAREIVNDGEICDPEATTAGAIAQVDGAARVPVMAETLTATVRPGEAGPVRIMKRIVNERQIVEALGVEEEEIRVERRIIERPVSASEGVADTALFEQIIIEIPLSRELGAALAAASMSEEIIVTKEVVERIEQVTGTVRREEVHIGEPPLGAK
jgi:uncharacterized protein (TIGR02271 family)